MTVWLLWYKDYDDWELIDIYSKKEDIEKARESLIINTSDTNYKRSTLYISQREVK